MVATREHKRTKIISNPRVRRDAIPGIHLVTEAEGRALFDFQARKLLGVSGDEFLARWDAGDYREPGNLAFDHKINRLVMLMPFARRVKP